MNLRFMCHAGALLRSDCEISNYITAVTRQRPINSNRRKLCSMRTVPRPYKQDKLGVALRKPMGFTCELLLWEAGSWGREQFGNQSKGNVCSWTPLPRPYKQDKLGVALRKPMGFTCELLLWEAGSWGREQFGNQSKGNVCSWKPLPRNG
jgi:hypothetical protein